MRDETESSRAQPADGAAGSVRARRRLGLGKKLLLSLLPVVLLLALGEIAARIFYTRPPAILLQAPLEGNVNLEIRDFFEFHPRLFWVLRPGMNRLRTDWGDITNARGFRMRSEPGDRGEAVRVLCLGDSVTYGVGLPLDAAWPATLDRRLEDAEVVNAGVPGYSTYQGRILFEDRCEDLEPDVLVVSFGQNDVLPWLTAHGGELVALSDRDRAVHLDYTRTSSRLLQWLRSGLLERTEVLEADLSKGDWRPRVPISEFRENLGHFAGLAPVVVFVAWPMRMALDPDCMEDFPLERLRRYHEVILSMGEKGHAVLDVGALFRASGLPPERLFLDTVHPTQESAAMVAKELARLLRERRPRLRNE